MWTVVHHIILMAYSTEGQRLSCVHASRYLAYIWKESQMCTVSVLTWQKCAEIYDREMPRDLLVSLWLHPHAKGDFPRVSNYFLSHDVGCKD